MRHHNRTSRSGAVAAVALLAAAGSLFAQNRPFPQHTGYAHGFVPANITTAIVQSSYDNWVATYLKNDCGSGYYRVEFGSPAGSTVSEGQGYGMVIAAYFGNRTAFDGLWSFAQHNFTASVGLMGWHVTCAGATTSDGGAGTATDGDTDIGFALVAAVDQWGDAYRAAAMNYLATLKNVDFMTCTNGRIMARAGNWGGGCTDGTNTSYWMPGYYRVFQAFTGDAFWGQAADDAEALLALNQNTTTGLIANTIDLNGATWGGQTYVDYNGCRIPWRVVLDDLWYGNATAQTLTTRMTTWANSVGISNLVDGYNLDGTASSSGMYTQQNPWVGGWTCGAMGASATAVNTFASDFAGIADNEGGYYGSSLRTLYLLMLSGNFWRPGSAAGDGGVSPTDAGSVSPDAGSSGHDGGSGVDAGVGSESSGAGHHGGCGCRTVSSRASGGLATLMALAAFIGRRRNRRSDTPTQ